jgi:hypothetical protein
MSKRRWRGVGMAGIQDLVRGSVIVAHCTCMGIPIHRRTERHGERDVRCR